MKQQFFKILFYCIIGVYSLSFSETQNPELGDVNWLRSYDKALEIAKETGKPLLILFQEVPGCDGCVNYGHKVLKEPLLVDAIENHFVPLAIFNNQLGQDREVLNHFKEPSWNFQVMRFFDSEGKEIIPRKDRVWSISETALRIEMALEKYGQEAPSYLKSLQN